MSSAGCKKPLRNVEFNLWDNFSNSITHIHILITFFFSILSSLWRPTMTSSVNFIFLALWLVCKNYHHHISFPTVNEQRFTWASCLSSLLELESNSMKVKCKKIVDVADTLKYKSPAVIVISRQKQNVYIEDEIKLLISVYLICLRARDKFIFTVIWAAGT